MGKNPVVTLKPTSSVVGSELFNSKVTATLLILIDATVVWIIAASDISGLNDVAFWTTCLAFWFVSLIVAVIGIVTNRTMLFVPVYVVWCATLVCSILFLIVDAYVDAYCSTEPVNKTSRWIPSCDLFLRHQSPFSSYILFMLLRYLQLFHTRSLAASIDAKKRSTIAENTVFCLGSVSSEEQPFLYWIFGNERRRGWQTWKVDFRKNRYLRHLFWLPGGDIKAKISVTRPRKEAESDDDDMVVFEKIAGTFKGDKPKINDMGRASIS
ncbi:hypothetical protein RB195_012890 [Necator americanus]